MNGVVDFDKQLEYCNGIQLEGGMLVDRSGELQRGLLEKASNGRIYYPPVDLRELFRAKLDSVPAGKQV